MQFNIVIDQINKEEEISCNVVEENCLAEHVFISRLSLASFIRISVLVMKHFLIATNRADTRISKKIWVHVFLIQFLSFSGIPQ